MRVGLRGPEINKTVLEEGRIVERPACVNLYRLEAKNGEQGKNLLASGKSD